MAKYCIMFFTSSCHATQFKTVEAENKGEAKEKLRALMKEQVYVLNVAKG